MKNKKSFNLFSFIFFKHILAVGAGMFVFGFVDNIILVLAGDAIDKTIAATFGFSTMFSAGVGNAISDSVGVLMGSVIAKFVYNAFGEVEKDEYPNWLIMTVETVAIFVGCIVGMFPLLFLS